MNWKTFELKYNKREEWAFEQLSYLLFCAELDNRIGLFRYKNQTGIETEPIEKNGIFSGFQAKHYTTSISQNKDDVIDSIKKAKTKNNQLNVIYLYLNQELSESPKAGKKKPKYQIDIEKAAQNIGVMLEWRVPSHIELQVTLPENKYIYDIFFNLDPTEGNLIDEVLKHNENILKAIQTEIIFNAKQIKIDRSLIIEKIVKSFDNKQNVIISGEGGCGKTAIFKEFYNLNFQKIPICIFKATELNVNHINDLFRFEHNFSFKQFLDTYHNNTVKIFVIDSAEKLPELANNDILTNLIQQLKETGWNIVFTTRYSYLNDLSFHIKENYQLSCRVIDIPIISFDDLKTISKENSFSLPENEKFSERLRNLFYLSEYVRYYSDNEKQGNFRSFIDLLWKKRIQNISNQKNNLHLDRDKCLIHIAKERCKTGRFYINIDDLPQIGLSQLKQDEILGYDDTHNGFFITHDIYEEWALDKIVSRNYVNHADPKQFFDKLGNSFPIRRAFRLWLSDQLSDSNKEIESFIESTFSDKTIIQFWKDELLVSVLLSDYSEVFFTKFDNEINANDFDILKRIFFLLRIACKEEDTFLSKLLNTDNSAYLFTKPKGKGWEETIKHIYKDKEILSQLLNNFIPLLEDWNTNTKRGNTTRISTLTALWFYEDFEKSDSSYGEEKKLLISIILDGALEIKEELETILELVIHNKWKYPSSLHYDLCHTILKSNNNNIAIVFSLPNQILKIADLFWFDTKENKSVFGYSGFGVEKYYSINDNCHFDYGQASALQTPIYWLLKSSFKTTIDFILGFTNKTIEHYAKSDIQDPVVLVDVVINESLIIKQYVNETIWCMYRGSGRISKPHLLESIHMALEKFLLEFVKDGKIDVVESYLFYLIQHSQSASITAIVTSVVLAYPERFYDIAMILFKTIEFFHIDGSRLQHENGAKSLYSIGYGLNKSKDVYADERLKTCKDEHRSLHLETLFLKYQFSGITSFTDEQNSEFIRRLYEIIDQHKSNISTNPKSEDESWGILLARMDRRNLIPKISKQDDNNIIVEFSLKELSVKDRNKSEQALKQFEETFKYSSLRTWSDFLIGKERQNSSQKHDEYDKNPLLALSEVKRLIEELNTGRDVLGIADYSIPAFVCSKLMIENRVNLANEDKDFCTEIILSFISRLFSDDYDYQISDGVEACVHTIPTLINEYPNETEAFISIMVLTLFDETPIGEYKRICDYVIESMHKSKLWEGYPTIAQAILLGYIKLKPNYKKIIDEKRKEKKYWGRIPKSLILEELDNTFNDFTFTEISFDINDIDLFDVHDLEIIYLLIPSNTKNEIHLEIYKRSLPLLASQLMKDRRSYREDSGDGSQIYLLRIHIFKRFACFILQRETNEIDSFLKPFVDSFNSTEETSQFLDEIISAEEYSNQYEKFWHIWNSLYPKILEISKTPRNFYLKNVINNYLLAWQWWREGIEEWRSLKKDNLSLYAKTSKDLGHIPSTLYSITKVLNSIASNFKSEGIEWIYNIVSNNESLDLGDLELNTMFYLEKFIRKFIFINKQKIKEEIRLKNKIIPILDFMVERGSINGYLLRESIL